MEPPPFGDGNAGYAADANITDALLQWSHRLSAMETAALIRHDLDLTSASMEPPPFGDGNSSCLASPQWISGLLQWSHRLSAMETLQFVSQLSASYLASMEPPPFGDGNREARSTTNSRRRCFNGATAFRRWKLWLAEVSPIMAYMLQWSHRLSAMETFEGGLDMSPQYCLLQWSHRLSAMETGCDRRRLRDGVGA